MTGASFTAEYNNYGAGGGAGVPPAAPAARSVIRLRMIGSWLLWLAWGWYAYPQL